MQTTKSATRERIPVITQQRLRDCFPVEHLICLSCGQVQEALLEPEFTVRCLTCSSTDLMNAGQHRRLKAVDAIDSLTLSELQRVVESLIVNQHQRGNFKTVAFLESKLLTLQQL